MNTIRIYQWRGKPIFDIEQWALDRGEKMVDVTWKIREVNPFARDPKGMIFYRYEDDTMPESFFNTLTMQDGRVVVKSKKRKPAVQRSNQQVTP